MDWIYVTLPPGCIKDDALPPGWMLDLVSNKHFEMFGDSYYPTVQLPIFDSSVGVG